MKSFFALLLAASAAAVPFSSKTSSHPVCVVGAGPAGLTAAHELQKLGYDTVVFEKGDTVGGKCQAYYDKRGQFHPLGALLFTQETYRETYPLIEESGLPRLPFAYDFKAWQYNWTTGIVAQSPFSFKDIYPHVENDVIQYITFWTDSFAPTMEAIGYPNGIPDELTVPFEQWLKTNGYGGTFRGIIEHAIVPYGYGTISETPTVYMLQYFTPDVLLFFAGQREGFIIDWHEVFVRFANKNVHGPIHTGVSISAIDRSGDAPTVSYTTSDGSKGTQTCDKLVLAFPPLVDNLEAANLELSDSEYSVFGPVRTTEYWGGAVRVATPVGYGYSAETFEPNGRPSAFMRLFANSDVATSWSWGTTGGGLTQQEAKQLLRETISPFNKNPHDTSPPQEITDEHIHGFSATDYFPRYEPAELRAGYFKKFGELQGQQNTYYASGFNGFETVEFAVRAGKDVVKSHFPHVEAEVEEIAVYSLVEQVSGHLAETLNLW
ncbi:hypothetical protein PHLCEN_2v6087 [Hermanssonia centrifuga]|uniref:Amine oxidase domain-containing protein n=1 Tax=Hermanssonia centrifuga TaxID=98765 RepID=A0A2R6P0E5_9APHY|nr:hypothetical protein PHLCEN_2v6087 [Hermanssonia centrifuga]